MAGKAYTVFKRDGSKKKIKDENKKKFKSYYYVQFRKPDGTWSNAITTHETTKGRAEEFAENYLKQTSGKVIAKNKMTFDNYTENFFSWDGQWATDKKVTGKRITERQCIHNQAKIKNYLSPFFGDMKLFAIDKNVIKTFRNELYNRNLSASFLNAILCVLHTVLEYAVDEDLIPGMPKIEKVANVRKGIEKGILTDDEVRQLFSIPWPSFPAYAANILMAATAARRGEVCALQLKNFHGDYIDIEKNYDFHMNQLTKTTKTGKVRRVIIPSLVKEVLSKLISMNPYGGPDDFIFFSDNRSRPLHGTLIMDGLYQALKDIGIDEVERRRRAISLHSWRVYFNSKMINAEIPVSKAQQMTGHTTLLMTQKTYYRADDMEDIKIIQEGIFKDI